LREKLFSDGNWSQPVALGAGILGSAPAVAIHANGEQDVFWRGTDGNLWETWYDGRWHGPVDLGDGPLGSGQPRASTPRFMPTPAIQPASVRTLQIVECWRE